MPPYDHLSASLLIFINQVLCRKNFPPFKFDIDIIGGVNAFVSNLFKKDKKLSDRFIPLPDMGISQNWNSDFRFAEQRLSGNNPIQIRALPANDPRANVLREAKANGAVSVPKLEEQLKQGV